MYALQQELTDLFQQIMLRYLNVEFISSIKITTTKLSNFNKPKRQDR